MISIRCLILGGLLAAVSVRAAGPASGVRVVDRPAEPGVELVVENTQPAPITLSITVTGQNATPDKAMPVIVTCPEPGSFPFVRLKPDREESFSWRVKYDWRYGQIGAKHDPKTVYELPFPTGKKYVVGQGFHGAFTHTGNDEYAVDFDMPIGSAVRAARAGRVVVVVDHFSEGGPNLELREKSNFVLVRHEDGTLAEYVHLQKAGSRVKVGQSVKVHDLIGLSGNVGYSQGPHLHFAVFRAINGIDRETFPVRFRTREGEAVAPEEGKTYTAP